MSHTFATIKDRQELQTLAIIKAETAYVKKSKKSHNSSILAQAPHLAWNP